MDHYLLIADNARLLAEVKAEASKHMEWATRWGADLDDSQARGNRAAVTPEEGSEEGQDDGKRLSGRVPGGSDDSPGTFSPSRKVK